MKSNSQTQKLAISPDRVDCGHGKDIDETHASLADRSSRQLLKRLAHLDVQQIDERTV